MHDVDCIIWSTGFRVSDFVAPMEVHGAGGARSPTSGRPVLTPTWG